MSPLRLAVRLGLRGLTVRKGRAALMMLGVAIGVVTLTLVVSIGRGATAKVERGIQSFGPDSVIVAAGSPQTRGPGDDKVTTLTPEDADAMRASIPGLRVLAPMVTRLEQSVVWQGNNMATTVVGSSPDYNEAWDWPVVAGEPVSEAHEASSARVAVLGQTVVRELFGGAEPIGESVRIGDQAFRVIGVLGPRGASPMGGDMDRRIVIPLSTAMRRLYNVSWYSMLRLRVANMDEVAAVESRVTALLRERHHIGPNDTDDFAVRSASSFRAMAAKMTGMLTTMLTIITIISLVAGAIVLASILTAAVAERRVEIGLNRALGATRRHIVRQLVVETMVVTILGGAVGVIVGSVAAFVLGRGGMVPAVVTLEPFVWAVLASVAVGLAAAILPARRAAGVEPAVALRP